MEVIGELQQDDTCFIAESNTIAYCDTISKSHIKRM